MSTEKFVNFKSPEVELEKFLEKENNFSIKKFLKVDNKNITNLLTII